MGLVVAKSLLVSLRMLSIFCQDREICLLVNLEQWVSSREHSSQKSNLPVADIRNHRKYDHCKMHNSAATVTAFWEGVDNTFFFLVSVHLVLLRVSGFWRSNLPSSCEDPCFSRPCRISNCLTLSLQRVSQSKTSWFMIHHAQALGANPKQIQLLSRLYDMN